MENEILSNDAEGKRRTRSPGYPSISLPDAIEKATKLWKKIDRHEAAKEVIAECWEMSKTSSTVPQTMAALKRYGLLEDVGTSDRRLVRLTRLAIEIINAEPSSKEKKDAIKQAALKPSIFAALWNRYKGNLNVSDGLVRAYLIVDREFNKDAVDGIIRSFRETITFADLSAEDDATGEESSLEEHTLPPMPTLASPPSMGRQTQFPAANPAKQLRMDLDSGPVVVNYPMSEEDFDLMVNTLNVWKPKLTKTLPTSESASE